MFSIRMTSTDRKTGFASTESRDGVYASVAFTLGCADGEGGGTAGVHSAAYSVALTSKWLATQRTVPLAPMGDSEPAEGSVRIPCSLHRSSTASQK